jgi:hypothetical protein
MCGLFIREVIVYKIMNYKITSLILGFSIAVSVLPMQVFAQYYDSSYYYDTQTSSSYDYTSPTVSGYDYTSPVVSSYDYTSPTVSAYDYTSPTVSGYNYTSPTVSGYNYTSPTVSAYDYTAPTVINTGYTQPTYTAPTYTNPTYTQPTYTTPTYTQPTYTTPTYTNPTYTTGGYTYPTYTYPGTTNTTICSNGSYPVNGSCTTVNTIPTINTTICSNGSYPVNGVCSVTNTIPTTSTTICSNGSYPVNGSCSTINTILTTNTTICSNGSYPVNGSCSNVITLPTTNTTVCSNGSHPVNGSCSTVNTIPTTSTTICSNGSYPVNGSCTNNIIVPVTTNYTYPTYTQPSYSYPTYSTPPMNYQVCWDGSTIAGYQTCPAQYRTCANGTYVALNQSCYIAPVPVYIPPVIVKFNNVVTSVVTQITNTSGRCNGIGLIANGAPSTGWFEYGETSNLGRTTASAAIGNTVTAPFSNVLASLKPHTTYFCRAVMQNQYGIVKGEIVSFYTKSVVTTYVKPVSTVKKVTTTKKVTTKKSEVVCVDGSYVSVKSDLSAAMLNKGDKLVMLQVEKVEGKLSANSPVSYKVFYKNLSESRLTGVVVKVVIPAEIKSVATTAGNYDENTFTLTLNQDTMDAYSEGVITISGTLAKDAPVGKTIVATAYVAYTVPGTHAQDEVTAYVVGSIVPTDSLAKVDTGAKKVIGVSGERGFMPNNLVEWLALIAIMCIIFILGRSIYLSYKEDEGDVHGH